MSKPDCYKCKYRGELIGDAHSSCQHPKVWAANEKVAAPFNEILAIFASAGRMPSVVSDTAKELNVMGNPHGIKNGWFSWPHNFDPVWLESCDGFTDPFAKDTK